MQKQIFPLIYIFANRINYDKNIQIADGFIMYKLVEVDDTIRVPPEKFHLGQDEAVKASLTDRWEGVIEKRLGVILAVTAVKSAGNGKIYPGDGAVNYPVSFEVLVYYPEQHEIVKGEVIEVTEFGAFLRMGAIDGMIHVSQIMDDFVSYDQKNAVFIGKESKHKLKEGEVVRARVISVSAVGGEYKIGLTARQPGLGALEWIKEDKDKQKKPRQAEKEKAPEKKK